MRVIMLAGLVLMMQVPGAGAQDFKQAVLDMQAVMKEAKQMHIVMDIRVYENEQVKALLYHDHAEVNRSGSNYLYRYSSNEFLMNEHCIVMVDKNEKEISYRKRDGAGEVDFSKQMTFDVDSILSLYENPQHINRDRDVDHFRILQKNGVVKQMDLYVSSVTHLMQQLDYLYNSGQYVSIRFDAFDVHPTFEVNQFDEGKYVSSVKGKISAAGDFRLYKVLSQ